ncbi:hypothetical protein GCM10010349_69560 [Streptomyces flavofungini]|nr:hypothetical protein GCM10010349_69560 [Streptomyces flavofungini]
MHEDVRPLLGLWVGAHCGPDAGTLRSCPLSGAPQSGETTGKFRAVLAAASLTAVVSMAGIPAASASDSKEASKSIAAKLSEATAGCAVLDGYGEKWVTIYNQCPAGIYATVSLDWSWDPACKYIGGYQYGTVKWTSNVLPDYAYEC